MITKYFVILLNVVVLVVGTLVLTLGLWGMNVGSQVSHLVSLTTPTLVMILGVVIVLVSLWGIYAAVNEDPLLMQIVAII
jgi:energy-converting hydrogenase Eha subunit A